MLKILQILLYKSNKLICHKSYKIIYRHINLSAFLSEVKFVITLSYFKKNYGLLKIQINHY